MLRLQIHSIIALFLLSLSLYAQKVGSIECSGIESFEEMEILREINLPKGTPVFAGIADTIKSRVTSLFLNEGFFFCDVVVSGSRDKSDTTFINYSLQATLYNRAKIHSIIVEFPDSLNKPYSVTSLESLSDEEYTNDFFSAQIDAVLLDLEEMGFPFASIDISSFVYETDFSDASLLFDMVLHINTGEQHTIDIIEIIGNDDTDETVILRELPLTIGDTYSEELLSEIPDNLNRLRFFHPVGMPEFYVLSTGEGVLRITVMEKQTNNFDGIIGYMPGDENEDGYVTGMVNVSMRNLFGTGRSAAVKWEQIDRNSQELQLKYQEPYVMGFPVNIGVELYQKKQDTSYVQRKFLGTIDYLAGENFTFSFEFASESTIPTESEYSVFSVYRANFITTGVNVMIDTRDDPYAPTRGIHFINGYSLSHKEITGPEEYISAGIKTKLALQRIRIDITGYYELFMNNIVSLGFHGREMIGEMQEQSDLYLLGGTNTLRGYREDQFSGSRIAWVNAEYRFMMSPRSYLFAFFDMGYYLRKKNDLLRITEISDTKHGYGLGMTLESGLGMLAISFALGQGDSFTDGKIHFGIINEF